jgi:hypothetical protein
MSWNFIKPIFEIFKDQSKYSLVKTKSTFKAYVEAIIPRTSVIPEKQGFTAVYGAVDSHIDEFETWSLDHLLSLNIIIFNVHIHLANATAKMLEIAAGQLIYVKENKETIDSKIMLENGSFACLAPNDRFRAITLLEENKVDITRLPVPFRNNPDLVFAIMGEIAMLALLAYYNEWSGYGITRMETPEKRRLEHFPVSWDQAGYPGPTNGYHDFRGYPV